MTDAPWTIIEGDSWDLLPAYADASVDHVITDPPFNERTSNGARSSNVDRGNVAYITFRGIDDREAELAQHLARVAKRWALAFCAFEQLGEYDRGAGDAWIRSGAWIKPDAMPQLTGDRPATFGEGIAIMHNPSADMRWNRKGAVALWTCNRARGNERYGGHPTPKPLALMVDLVKAFTDPGDLVLDPFCGSGTTGVACLANGRRFIGIEKNQEYAGLARRRLAAWARDSDVRSADAGQLPLLGDDR